MDPTAYLTPALDAPTPGDIFAALLWMGIMAGVFWQDVVVPLWERWQARKTFARYKRLRRGEEPQD